MIPDAVAPELTESSPPLDTVTRRAEPPPSTVSSPPSRMAVALAMPPESICWEAKVAAPEMTAPFRKVLLATPPLSTSCSEPAPTRVS